VPDATSLSRSPTQVGLFLFRYCDAPRVFLYYFQSRRSTVNFMNEAQVRQFMLQYYNDDEFQDFVFDYFPDVNRNLAVSATLHQKVREFVSHVVKYGRMDHLLAALQETRPDNYAATFGSTHFPRSTSFTPRNPRQVFVSYAISDTDIAHRLADDLHRAGYTIWIAPESILPGEKWVTAINRGLESSGIFLLVLSPRAVESKWVRDETDAAIVMENEGQVRVFIVRISASDVPRLWGLRQHVSIEENYRQGLTELLRALAGGSALPPVPPRPPNPEASRRNPAWLIGLGILAVMVFGLIVTSFALIFTRTSASLNPQIAPSESPVGSVPSTAISQETVAPTSIPPTNTIESTEVAEVINETKTPTVTPEPEIATPSPTLDPNLPRIFGFQACENPCEGEWHTSLFRPGTTHIDFKYSYENFPNGAPYTRTWSRESLGEWVRYECNWDGPQAGVFRATLWESEGLLSGVWTLRVTVNGIELLREQLEVQGTGGVWTPVKEPFTTCGGN
jgi:hypothetical protein